MGGFILMKKYLILLATLFVLFAFTGCRPIELEEALKNNSKINSASYEASIRTDELDENDTIKSMLGKVDIVGKTMKSEDDTILNFADIKLASEDVDFNIPVYTYANKKDVWDFDMFIGTPDALKELLGEQEDANLYLSGNDLKEFLKENLEEEEFKKIEDQIDAKEESDASQVTKDILEVAGKYINKNKKEIKSFKKLDNKSTRTHGVYTINLNKNDFMNITNEYFDNEKYCDNLQETLDVSNSEQSQETTMKDIKENIDEMFNEIGHLDVLGVFIIEDKYVTNIKFEIKGTRLENDEETTIFTTIELRLGDINQELEIVLPDKNDEKNINVIELVQSFMSMMTFDIDGMTNVENPEDIDTTEDIEDIENSEDENQK